MHVRRPESRSEIYQRRARINDRLAREYAQAANRQERFAASAVDERSIANAHRRADRARESADRCSSRSDALRAAAATFDEAP
jgi:hypothetical protein